MFAVRRSILRHSGALAASLIATPLVRAQAASFPIKPITLVVRFAPGGNVDIVSRSVAVPLGKILGQSVIVDNRAGGSGSIGTGVVARAAPDGYTLLVATAGQVVTLPQMFKTPYRGDSLKPLGLVSKTHIATIVRKGDQRFKNFQELVAYAKPTLANSTAAMLAPARPTTWHFCNWKAPWVSSSPWWRTRAWALR